MRATASRLPWTAQLPCISWCWTAGRKTGTTDPSLSRLSAFWTSSSGIQAAWRSSPVQQQGDTLAVHATLLPQCMFPTPPPTVFLEIVVLRTGVEEFSCDFGVILKILVWFLARSVLSSSLSLGNVKAEHIAYFTLHLLRERGISYLLKAIFQEWSPFWWCVSVNPAFERWRNPQSFPDT